MDGDVSRDTPKSSSGAKKIIITLIVLIIIIFLMLIAIKGCKNIYKCNSSSSKDLFS
jgi:hypothetical protein